MFVGDKKTNGERFSHPLVPPPVYAGGFKNLTHNVIYHDSGRGLVILIKPTLTQLFLYYCLLFMGMVLLCYDVYMWTIGDSVDLWTTFFAGVILLGVGVIALLKSHRLRFFIDSSAVLYDKYKIFHYANIKKYEFTQMYSLQVINKLVVTGKGITPFRSYELNLTLKSGERINLLHDNKLEHLMGTTKKLGRVLNIPCVFVENEQKI